MANEKLINQIQELCKNKGIAVNKMLNDCFLGKDVVANLKKGSVPNVETASKIADYFNVTVDYLLGKANGNAPTDPSALPDYLQMAEINKNVIPVLGAVIAGKPVLSPQNFEGYIYTNHKPADEHFALIVRGDSMKDDGINDGNLVIVHKQSVAESGQIVVILLNNDELTIKKFLTADNGQYLLMPANSAYTPIILTEEMNPEILGVVVELRRSF